MMADNKEEWKDIPGYEGYYQASNMGRIRSVNRYVQKKDGKMMFCKSTILKTFNSTYCKYQSVQFSKDNIPRKFLLHRLIAATYYGKLPPNMEVNHKNGNTLDNRVVNLEVVTHQENIDHSVSTGLKNDYGEKHVNAKLTNKQAEEIRMAHRRGVMQVDLAEAYGVHKQTICNIVHNKTYIK
jgi:hypothetical protein